MPDAIRPRVPADAVLLGVAIPVALAGAVAALELEYAPTLLVAAVAFLVAGLVASRGAPHALGPMLLALTVPTLALFALLAVNAESWLLLGVPAVAVAASAAGLLARRWRRGTPAGAVGR